MVDPAFGRADDALDGARHGAETGVTKGVVYGQTCDGGRSLIRKAAGIELLGWDPTISHQIAEVEMAEEPKWG